MRSCDGVSASGWARKKWAKAKPGADAQRSLLDEGGVAVFVPPADSERSEASTEAAGGDRLTRSSRKGLVEIPWDAKPIAAKRTVRACNCKSWFCEHCAGRMGRRKLGELIERLRQFVGVYGITFTLDPELFPDPLTAYLYVMGGNGLIGRTIRELHRRGWLKTRHYFVVIEWHENGWPHWHVLVDSKFIPFGEIVEVWATFRPVWAPAVPRITAENYKGQRPSPGGVRFTWRHDKPESPEAAAHYAAAYLCKLPENGFPEWVLNYEGQIKRQSHSQGFFKRAGNCEPTCFCKECCERIDNNTVFVETIERVPRTSEEKADAVVEQTTVKRPRRNRRIRDRVESCRQTAVIVETTIYEDEAGNIYEGTPRFVQGLNLSWDEVLKLFGQEFERPYQIELVDEQMEYDLRVEAGLPGDRLWFRWN